MFFHYHAWLRIKEKKKKRQCFVVTTTSEDIISVSSFFSNIKFLFITLFFVFPLPILSYPIHAMRYDAWPRIIQESHLGITSLRSVSVHFLFHYFIYGVGTTLKPYPLVPLGLCSGFKSLEPLVADKYCSLFTYHLLHSLECRQFSASVVYM